MSFLGNPKQEKTSLMKRSADRSALMKGGGHGGLDV
jgi:hypothetical protein